MADITTVVFWSEILCPKDASILFRSALGGVTYLRDSLLGNRPKIFAGNDAFDMKRHQAMRKFSDEKSLAEFVEYLSQVIRDTPAPHPIVAADIESPIDYLTASSNAEIAILAHSNGWSVVGMASFKDPTIAVKILEELGLTVEVQKEDKEVVKGA